MNKSPRNNPAQAMFDFGAEPQPAAPAANTTPHEPTRKCFAVYYHCDEHEPDLQGRFKTREQAEAAIRGSEDSDPLPPGHRLVVTEEPAPKSTFTPELTLSRFRAYRKAWRTAYAAFGGFPGAGGWIMDLVLRFDPNWNTETGEVGPARWFLTELNPWHPEAAETRELQLPEGVNVGRAYALLKRAGLGKVLGYAPCKVLDENADRTRLKVRQDGRILTYVILADVSEKELGKTAKMKFVYHDQAYRTHWTKAA